MAADPDSRIKDVLDDILTLVGGMAYTGANANRLTTGQETMPRGEISSGSVSTGNQSFRLTYFTGRKAETSSQISVSTGATAAAATPTLVRFGLYTIAANGAGTLVASTPNDTTLFAAANTTYTKSWSAPYAMVTGQRYALGILVVTGAAAPTLLGAQVPITATNDVLSSDPRLTGMIAAQADLPASFANASVTANAARAYAAILP